MCNVMKYLFIAKNEMVFDYESSGDLFYMVIKGKVSCKVPFYKQVILLSDDEKIVFCQENRFDLLGISEASDVNKQFGLDISGGANSDYAYRQQKQQNALAKEHVIDMKTMQILKNIYNVDRLRLQKHC